MNAEFPSMAEVMSRHADWQLPDSSVVHPLAKQTASSIEKHFDKWWVAGADRCVTSGALQTCVPALLIWHPEWVKP